MEQATQKNADEQRRHKIRIRMTTVSSAVRKAELATTSSDQKVLALKSDDNGTLVADPVAQQAMAAKMEKIRKARRFSGKHMPVLQCNACSMSRVCPKFKAGFECAFLPFLNSHRVETPTDLVHYMKEVVGMNMKRAHLMTMIETANGGMPSLETSEALGLAFQQLTKLHEVMTDQGSIEVSLDTNDGSIVGSLFGGLKAIMADTAAMKEQQAELASAIPLPAIAADAQAQTPEDVVDELVQDFARQEADMLPVVKAVDVSGHPSMKQVVPSSGTKMPTIEVSTQ